MSTNPDETQPQPTAPASGGTAEESPTAATPNAVTPNEVTPNETPAVAASPAAASVADGSPVGGLSVDAIHAAPTTDTTAVVPPPALDPTQAQETIPLPDSVQPPAAVPGLAQHPAPSSAPYSSVQPSSPQHPSPQHSSVASSTVPQQTGRQHQSRNGGLVAGIAIGALLGGLVGGGAAAVVAHNATPRPAVQAQANGGSLTLNNLDTATAITGVAAIGTPSVVTLQVSGQSSSGSGSGVIYTADGYIITNAHVATLEGETADPQIQVQLSDGTLLPGKLIGSDPFADIAVVKVDTTGLTPIVAADSEKINVGDLAVAIGAPLSLSNTVTSGVVSALNRGISVSSSMVPEQQPQDDGQSDQNPQDQQQSNPFPWFEFQGPNGEMPQQQLQSSGARVAIPVIQTDASINPGNSGGALLNAHGELIGINVALASAGGDSGTAGSDGLGFAVPSNLAVRVADALIAGEQPSHGLLGVTQTTDASTTNAAGGVIGEVTAGSPAEKAGLRSGDVITSVNGVRADSFTTVTALVRMHAAGSQITIGYNRNGTQYETEVTLGELDW